MEEDELAEEEKMAKMAEDERIEYEKKKAEEEVERLRLEEEKRYSCTLVICSHVRYRILINSKWPRALSPVEFAFLTF